MLLVNNTHTTQCGPPSIENFVCMVFLHFLHSPPYNYLYLELGKINNVVARQHLIYYLKIFIRISVSNLASCTPFINSYLLISLPSTGYVKFFGVSSFTRPTEPLFREDSSFTIVGNSSNPGTVLMSFSSYPYRAKLFMTDTQPQLSQHYWIGSDMRSKYLIKLSAAAVKLITMHGYFGLSRTNFESLYTTVKWDTALSKTRLETTIVYR